jgi:nitroreductase
MARAMVSAQHLVDHFHEVPAQILVGSVDRVPQEPRGPFASMFYGSVYPALWSLQLALRSRGLGSALTCIHLHYEQEVAEILDLPEQFTQVALLPVAYTRGLDFKVARRAPAEQVVTWR